MGRKFTLGGGAVHDADTLSAQGQATLAALDFVTAQIAEATQLHAALARAHQGYTEDLKREIIKSRSGVDIAALFAD